MSSLTYNLYVNNSCVHVVFNLHCHLILPRVAALRFTDEDDAITVCIADVNMGRLYWLSLLQPGDLWSGFTLVVEKSRATLVQHFTSRLIR